MSPLLTDTVEKGFWWGRPKNIIQDHEQSRNLDSKIHLLEVVRFDF